MHVKRASVPRKTHLTHRVALLQRTCFKGSLESLVHCGGVYIAFELNPNHVPLTLYRTRFCISTQAIGQNWSVIARNYTRITSRDGCFTELNIIISAVFTILQIKRVEVYLDLLSFRNN